VVGVVGDMKAIADPQDCEVVGMLARPLMQLMNVSSYQVDELTFIVRREGNSANESAIRAALARADSRVAPYQMISLGQAASDSRTTERFVLILVSLFGILGLLLAAVGLYGLLSLQVARREREFGIRSALGARAQQIARLVGAEGMRLLGIGFAAGAIVSWGIVRLVQSQWAGMPAPNLIAWCGGGIVLSIVTGLACWLPARRASRVDPVVALRAE